MRRPSNLMLTTTVPQAALLPPEPSSPKNYLDLYGLSKPPFTQAPDPRNYILFTSHKRAFELLVEHVTSITGTVLLFGEEGIGKTATVRSIASVASDAGLRTIVVSRPPNGRVSVMQLVSALKGQPSADNVTQDDAIAHFLTPPRKVLVADDVDLMPPDCVRLLCTLAQRIPKDQSGPAVVLSTSTNPAGEPKQAELAELASLARNTIRLPRLSPAEVEQYIERSLWIAGGTTRRLIAADAMKPIIARSGGIPGVTNLLMEAVLTAGFARGDSMISAKTVAAATGPTAPRPQYREDRPPDTAGRVMQVVAVALLVVGASAFLYRGLTGPAAPARSPGLPTPPPITTIPERPAPLRPVETLSPELVSALVKRGDQSLSLGDIAAARLLYQRAADAGNAAAATALGRTFDPNALTPGSKADPAIAAQWYQKAITLGDPHATELLKKLGDR